MYFVINGKPKGKSRPRFRRIKNYVSTYNDKSTIEYEKLVKNAFINQCLDKININYQSIVKISILAHFKPNKSLSKKKSLELINKPYTKKPDCDNIAKIILDGLNGLAYLDDSKIYSLNVEKIYSNEDYVEVNINYE